MVRLNTLNIHLGTEIGRSLKIVSGRVCLWRGTTEPRNWGEERECGIFQLTDFPAMCLYLQALLLLIPEYQPAKDATVCTNFLFLILI